MKNLVDLIINNLSFLGFDENFYMEDCYPQNKEILRYFLNKDISTIIGKTSFRIDYINLENNEIEIDKYSVDDVKKIMVRFYNIEYSFLNRNNSLIILKDGMIVTKISCDNENRMYQNTLMNVINVNNKVDEIQRININYDIDCFEYLKTINYLEGKIECPVLRMKPIGSKKNDIEYFELTISEKNKEKGFIQKIINKYKSSSIVGIPTSYNIESTINYLTEIYGVMEDFLEKRNYSLKRKR